jgi:hypothetical protein
MEVKGTNVDTNKVNHLHVFVDLFCNSLRIVRYDTNIG